MNLFEVEVQYDADDPEGYKTGYARLGPLLGAAMLGGGSIYVLAADQSICPTGTANSHGSPARLRRSSQTPEKGLKISLRLRRYRTT